MRGKLFTRLSFSSFSPTVDDIWGCEVARPYQILLMPGYTLPAGLDTGDKDALWHPRPDTISSPVVVWDGFCPVALHEIILECFDPDGTSPFIKVFEVETDREVPDPRPADVLAVRPPRPAGLGPNGIFNHLVELQSWAYLLDDRRTFVMYCELVEAYEADTHTSIDSRHRQAQFFQCGMRTKDPYEEWSRMHRSGAYQAPPLASGPDPGKDDARAERDKHVQRLSTTVTALSGFESLTLDDLPAPGVRPDSYYDLVQKTAQRNLRAKQKEVASFATKRAETETITDRNPTGERVIGEYPIWK